MNTNEQEVMRFMQGRDWTGPTVIGEQALGLAWGGSAKSSPICKKLVAAGLLQRNSRGHYRLAPAHPDFDARDAAPRLLEYAKRYVNETGLSQYSRRTFTLDALFGIAIALGYEKSPDGFDAFKAELREMLS